MHVVIFTVQKTNKDEIFHIQKKIPNISASHLFVIIWTFKTSKGHVITALNENYTIIIRQKSIKILKRAVPVPPGEGSTVSRWSLL